MRILFPLLFVACASVAAAQDTPAQTVIHQQIEALKADDFTGAFGFASPNIQRLFRNPERFGLMVQQGYPMVARPRSVEYLGARLTKSWLWQRVRIVDAKGQTHDLDYQMLQTKDGWRIDGVFLVPARGVDA